MSEVKAREFWIDTDNYAHSEDSMIGFENATRDESLIHAVEHSAYQALKEEITRLQQELGKEIESHRETVRVLEQYGCESFYTRATLENHKGETFKLFSDAEIDIGKRAQALYNLIEATSGTLDDLQHYYDNKCIPTVDEINRLGIAESHARIALGDPKALGGGDDSTRRD